MKHSWNSHCQRLSALLDILYLLTNNCIMSRKPAAPKPEELIAKLDEKFESFKEEITQSLEDRTADIEKANQNNVEVRDLIDKHREEDKKELDSVKNTLEQLVERKLEDVQRY